MEMRSNHEENLSKPPSDDYYVFSNPRIPGSYVMVRKESMLSASKNDIPLSSVSEVSKNNDKSSTSRCSRSTSNYIEISSDSEEEDPFDSIDIEKRVKYNNSLDIQSQVDCDSHNVNQWGSFDENAVPLRTSKGRVIAKRKRILSDKVAEDDDHLNKVAQNVLTRKKKSSSVTRISKNGPRNLRNEMRKIRINNYAKIKLKSKTDTSATLPDDSEDLEEDPWNPKTEMKTLDRSRKSNVKRKIKAINADDILNYSSSECELSNDSEIDPDNPAVKSDKKPANDDSRLDLRYLTRKRGNISTEKCIPGYSIVNEMNSSDEFKNDDGNANAIPKLILRKQKEGKEDIFHSNTAPVPKKNMVSEEIDISAESSHKYADSIVVPLIDNADETLTSSTGYYDTDTAISSIGYADNSATSSSKHNADAAKLSGEYGLSSAEYSTLSKCANTTVVSSAEYANKTAISPDITNNDNDELVVSCAEYYNTTETLSAECVDKTVVSSPKCADTVTISSVECANTTEVILKESSVTSSTYANTMVISSAECVNTSTKSSAECADSTETPLISCANNTVLSSKEHADDEIAPSSVDDDEIILQRSQTTSALNYEALVKSICSSEMCKEYEDICCDDADSEESIYEFLNINARNVDNEKSLSISREFENFDDNTRKDTYLSNMRCDGNQIFIVDESSVEKNEIESSVIENELLVAENKNAPSMVENEIGRTEVEKELPIVANENVFANNDGPEVVADSFLKNLNGDKTATRSLRRNKPTLYVQDDSDDDYPFGGSSDDSYVPSEVEDSQSKSANNAKNKFKTKKERVFGTTKGNHVCKYCGEGFNAASKLKDHYNSHTKEIAYKCGQCENSVFYTKASFAEHKQQHESKKRFACETCERSFATESVLEDHKNTHSGLKPYICAQCDQSFSYKHSLLNHIRRFHLSMNGSNCKYCHRIFDNFPDLISHERIHRDRAKNKHHECSYCDRVFKYRPNMLSHIRASHTGERPYGCYYCEVKLGTPKRFGERTTLIWHLKTHTGERDYTCEVCGRKFGRPNALKNHFRLLHSMDLPHVCNECGKGFTTMSNLIRHTRKHTGDRPFCCDICGKGFLQSNSLKIHKMGVHTGERPHPCKLCDEKFLHAHLLSKHVDEKHNPDRVTDDEETERHRAKSREYYAQYKEKDHVCDICGKSFNKLYLKRHMSVHMGTKPFQCEQCPKSFSQRTVYANHLKVHTLERPHICKICKETFQSNGELKKHTKTAHTALRTHVCEFCQKAFLELRVLKLHLKLHTSMVLYRCDHCEKTFKHNCNLNVHSKKMHNLPSSGKKVPIPTTDVKSKPNKYVPDRQSEFATRGKSEYVMERRSDFTAEHEEIRMVEIQERPVDLVTMVSNEDQYNAHAIQFNIQDTHLPLQSHLMRVQDEVIECQNDDQPSCRLPQSFQCIVTPESSYMDDRTYTAFSFLLNGQSHQDDPPKKDDIIVNHYITDVTPKISRTWKYPENGEFEH